MDSHYQVGPDTVVHFSYELVDEEGEVAESSDEPISFLFGYGQLTPALETAFEGLRGGDKRKVSLTQAEAFGPRRQEAVIEVDRAEFGPNVEIGDEFEAEHDDGGAVSLVVLEVLDDLVVLDANHPLAGQTVSVAIRVEAVRPATRIELAQAVEELESTERASQTLLPSSRLVRRPLEQA